MAITPCKYNLGHHAGAHFLDPFGDKVIALRHFLLFYCRSAGGMLAEPWGLRAWMVVVIVGRELLVTALRSFLEERGSDFSANMSGKLKMVLQSLAAASSLVFLHFRASDKP